MSGNDSSTASPKGNENRVQNGRVEKSKKKELKIPTYRIGGRTYACEGCKKGHRVSKCTHAGERPVSMTHDPGRPSGDQKRHCDCPKQCACTKKNCKCDRNCSCTQTMYMLVYVPMKNETGEKPDEGEWRVDKEVVTDLHGKQLTEDEIRARNELKSQQQYAKSSPPSIGLAQPKQAPPAVSGSCCHKKNIQEQTQQIPVQEQETKLGQRRPQCNCGSGCSCAFCLDHPNNQTSHLLAQRQAALFTNQSYGQHPNPSWAAPSVGGSCMGTNPHFAISNTPNPSFGQFQSMFPPAGSGSGYYISYQFNKALPVTQPFVEPLLSPTIEVLEQTPMLVESEPSISATPMPASATSCCHASTIDDLDFTDQQQVSLPGTFDFTNYDLGQAVTAGWHGSPNNPYTFDHLDFDPDLDSFSTPLPDLNILPSRDIMSSIQSMPNTQHAATISSPVHFDRNLTDIKHFSGPVTMRLIAQDHVIAPSQLMQPVETSPPIPTQPNEGYYPQNCCHHGQPQNFISDFCAHHGAHPNLDCSSSTMNRNLNVAFGGPPPSNSFSPVQAHASYGQADS